MIKTFQELSKKRMRKVTKALNHLGITVAYMHTEEEAEVLMCDLQAAINRVEAVFSERWGWGADEATSSISSDTWRKLYAGAKQTVFTDQDGRVDVRLYLQELEVLMDLERERMTGFVVSTSVTEPKDPDQ
jgi:hypothetical protein